MKAIQIASVVVAVYVMTGTAAALPANDQVSNEAVQANALSDLTDTVQTYVDDPGTLADDVTNLPADVPDFVSAIPDAVGEVAGSMAGAVGDLAP